VIAPDAVDADAYATAVFVLGPEKGLALLRSLPGVEGIVVDSVGNVLWSDKAALKR
jgi:thiamine biosynthesis lipoprotein